MIHILPKIKAEYEILLEKVTFTTSKNCFSWFYIELDDLIESIRYPGDREDIKRHLKQTIVIGIRLLELMENEDELHNT